MYYKCHILQWLIINWELISWKVFNPSSFANISKILLLMIYTGSNHTHHFIAIYQNCLEKLGILTLYYSFQPVGV